LFVDSGKQLRELEVNYLPKTRVITSKCALTAFGATKVSQKIDEVTSDGLITHSFSKAHHMAEAFKDIHAALVSEKNKNLSVSVTIKKNHDVLSGVCTFVNLVLPLCNFF